MNVPNTLTVLRIIFAIAVFYCCAVRQWEYALLFFIIASLTDFVDGWWARKFNQITVFGRIMDPFADKFLICGVFICLLQYPDLLSVRIPTYPDSLLLFLSFQPWMVIVIVARELLITSLRAVIEKSGGDFSAKWIGKWKMGAQCLAVIFAFILLSCRGNSFFVPNELVLSAVQFGWLISLWVTVLITLYSGISYSIRAAKVIKMEDRG